MFSALLNVSLLKGGFPITVGVLSAIALGVVVTRRPARRWALAFALAAAAGAGIGFGLAWFLGDVQNDFGIVLAFSTRAWFAVGIAGAAVAGVSLWRAKRWRIPAGIAAIGIFALLTGVGINATIGEYPTLADAFGVPMTHPLHLPPGGTIAAGNPTTQPLAPSVSQPLSLPESQPLWATWTPPRTMPRRGSFGTVAIPGVVSHFVARRAVVYLPPAARVANPPALPVVVFLGGEPGSPATVVAAGQMPEIMNAFAEAHRGLAPIVIVPDQLGASKRNPMCLNSALGNVETYLTVDVPNWAKSHLRVRSGRDNWAIGGFSEGGTCSIQLGTKYRALFGSILDISGQIAPLNGTVPHTIRVGFGGSVAAYRADTAPALLAAGAPFSSTLGIFVVGQNDARYGPQAHVVERAAVASLMQVKSFSSPGTAHDWYTEQYGLRVGIPLLAQRWGLTH